MLGPVPPHNRGPDRMTASQMADILKPDLCVIGAGAHGLAIALAARRYGARVVLIDQPPEDGEDPQDSEAVAALALAESGRRAEAMREASRFGLANADPRPSLRAVNEHVLETLSATGLEGAPARLEALGVTVLEGPARFIDKRTLGAGGRTIRARRFVIALGARPVVPEVEGLSEVPYFTGRSLFSNAKKLTHLVVIGAGRTGIAMAQAYRRLGSDVTVIEPHAPLARTDPELARVVLDRLGEEGVALRIGAGLRRIVPRAQGIGVEIAQGDGPVEKLDASHILLAAGRVADLAGLEVEKAGLRRNPADPARLFMRPGLRTSNRRIFAVGAAAGGYHAGPEAALDAARIVLSQALFGRPAWPEPVRVPRVLFSDPGIAEIGMTEPEARARLKDRYSVLRGPFSENARARAERRTEGLVKLILNERGRILGAGIVGPDAGEAIALYGLAIANGLGIEALGALVAPHPSHAEIAARLAAEHAASAPPARGRARLAALMRLLP